MLKNYKKIKKEHKHLSILNYIIKTGMPVPYFQPIIDLQEKNIFAWEVLARFNGFNAYRIIVLAEKTNKIKEIDKITIKKALEIIKNNPLYFANRKISFNFTPLEFVDLKYYKWFCREIKKNKINFDDCIIEITERKFLDKKKLATRIKNVKKDGFLIAIDDFGSGYNSLTCWENLDFDFLKLDYRNFKSINKDVFLNFLDNICNNCMEKIILECIDEENGLEILLSNKIKYVQSFFFGKLIKME